MSNQDVIKAFLEGKKAKTNLRKIRNDYGYYKGRTLTTDGNTLTNYNTVIAFKFGNKLYINSKKYSVTTSKIQSQLRYLMQDYYTPNDITYYTD